MSTRGLYTVAAFGAALLLGVPQGFADEVTTAEVNVTAVTPDQIGAAASTTIRVTGTGFAEGQSVSLRGCPVTNPGAVYPIPFPNPGTGQQPGSVQVIDENTMLITTPSIIPAGTCELVVDGANLADAVTFVDAPERLRLTITNDTDLADSQLWVTLGYNCPRVIPSPPYPPGTAGCDVDGRSNSDYAWPAGDSGTNPNRYWYEAYTDDTPVKAFTGVRFTDLSPLPGQAHTRVIDIANIDSGVVYLAHGQPVNTGASPDGRAPSYVTSPVRFDVFEVTFHGSGASAGPAAPGGTWTNPVYANITAVAGVSLLMELSGWDNSVDASGPNPQRIGEGISWQTGTDTDDLVSSLRAAGVDVDDTRVVVTSDGKPYQPGTFLRIVSPSTNGGSGYANLRASSRSYLSWLSRQQKVFTIVGQYSGAGFGSGTWYCYTSSVFHRRSVTTLTGTVGYPTRSAARRASTNNCTPGGSAVAGPVITTATSPISGVEGPVTSRSVYMQDNSYLQDGAVATGNDLANAVYRDFITSFGYGFWGSRAGAAGWTTASWATVKGSAPAFAAGWPGYKRATTYPRWNTYAGSIWQFTNAYGMPYSDTFGNGGRGNPLISGTSITTLKLTIAGT